MYRLLLALDYCSNEGFAPTCDGDLILDPLFSVIFFLVSSGCCTGAFTGLYIYADIQWLYRFYVSKLHRVEKEFFPLFKPHILTSLV